MTTILVSTDSDGLVFRVRKEGAQQSNLPCKVFVGIDPDKFRQYDAVATLLTGSLTEGVEFRDAITDRLVKSLF